MIQSRSNSVITESQLVDSTNLISCHATTFMTAFRPILEKKCGSSKNPFQKFLGARFNILGRNAVYLYCLRSQLKDFLKLTATNMLLRSVQFDLDQPGTMAEVRTLGMLSKLIMLSW